MGFMHLINSGFEEKHFHKYDLCTSVITFDHTQTC